MPTAWGLLHSSTPAAQIQGLLGALPTDPWLHLNLLITENKYKTDVAKGALRPWSATDRGTANDWARARTTI